MAFVDGRLGAGSMVTELRLRLVSVIICLTGQLSFHAAASACPSQQTSGNPCKPSATLRLERPELIGEAWRDGRAEVDVGRDDRRGPTRSDGMAWRPRSSTVLLVHGLTTRRCQGEAWTRPFGMRLSDFGVDWTSRPWPNQEDSGSCFRLMNNRKKYHRGRQCVCTRERRVQWQRDSAVARCTWRSAFFATVFRFEWRRLFMGQVRPASTTVHAIHERRVSFERIALDANDPNFTVIPTLQSRDRVRWTPK